jgi:hypothetical protein
MEHPAAERHGPPALVCYAFGANATGYLRSWRPATFRLASGTIPVLWTVWGVSGLVVLATGELIRSGCRARGWGLVRCSSAFTLLAVDGPYHALTGFQRTTPYRGLQNVGGCFGGIIRSGVLDLGVPMSNKSKE